MTTTEIALLPPPRLPDWSDEDWARAQTEVHVERLTDARGCHEIAIWADGHLTYDLMDTSGSRDTLVIQSRDPLAAKLCALHAELRVANVPLSRFHVVEPRIPGGSYLDPVRGYRFADDGHGSWGLYDPDGRCLITVHDPSHAALYASAHAWASERA